MIGGVQEVLPPAHPIFFNEQFGGAMARYEHLPIYKKAMDLTIYFEKVVRNFHQYQKYALSIRNLQSTPEIPNKD
jgi:hypothetical protein